MQCGERQCVAHKPPTMDLGLMSSAELKIQSRLRISNVISNGIYFIAFEVRIILDVNHDCECR